MHDTNCSLSVHYLGVFKSLAIETLFEASQLDLRKFVCCLVGSTVDATTKIRAIVSEKLFCRACGTNLPKSLVRWMMDSSASWARSSFTILFAQCWIFTAWLVRTCTYKICLWTPFCSTAVYSVKPTLDATFSYWFWKLIKKNRDLPWCFGLHRHSRRCPSFTLSV